MVTVTTVAKSISGLTRTELGSGVADFSTTSTVFVDATDFNITGIASEKFVAYHGRFDNSASSGNAILYIDLATDIFSLLAIQGQSTTIERTIISDILANTDAGSQTVQLQSHSNNATWTETVLRDDSGTADSEIATFWQGPNAIVYQSAAGVNAHIEHGLKINITQLDGNVFTALKTGTWHPENIPASIPVVEVMANAFSFSITQFQSKTANLDNVVTNGMIFDSNKEFFAMIYDWAGTNIRVT